MTRSPISCVSGKGCDGAVLRGQTATDLIIGFEVFQRSKASQSRAAGENQRCQLLDGFGVDVIDLVQDFVKVESSQ